MQMKTFPLEIQGALEICMRCHLRNGDMKKAWKDEFIQKRS